MKDKLLFSLLMMLHSFVVENMSATVRKEIVDFSNRLEKLAESNKNGVDDIAVKLLKILFGID